MKNVFKNFTWLINNIWGILKKSFLLIFVPIYIGVIIYGIQELNEVTKKQIEYYDATLLALVQYNENRGKAMEENFILFKNITLPINNNIHTFLNNRKIKDGDNVIDNYLQSLYTIEINSTTIVNSTEKIARYEASAKQESNKLLKSFLLLKIYSNSDMNELKLKINRILEKSNIVFKKFKDLDEMNKQYIANLTDPMIVVKSIYTKQDLATQYIQQLDKLKSDSSQQIKSIQKDIQEINQLDKEINSCFYTTLHNNINQNSFCKIFYILFKTPNDKIFDTNATK